MRQTVMMALMMSVATLTVGTKAWAGTSDDGYVVVDPYAHYRKHPVTDRTRFVAPRTRAVQSRAIYSNSSRRIGGSAYGTYGNRTNARVINSREYVVPTVAYVDVDRDESISDAVYDGVEDHVVLVQPYDSSRRYAGYTPGYSSGHTSRYNTSRSYGARRYYGDGYSRPQAYRSRIYIDYGYDYGYNYGHNYGHGYSRHGYGYGRHYGQGYGHQYGHGYRHGYGYGHGGYGYGGNYGHYRGGHRSHSGVSFHFRF